MLRRQVISVRFVLFAFAVTVHYIPFAKAATRSDQSAEIAPASAKTGKAADDSHVHQVAPGVYSYKDTCNVYAIVKNHHAILIDFGSGEILSRLQLLGVEKVD